MAAVSAWVGVTDWDWYRFLQGPRLRADWGNGEEFYQRAWSGEAIGMPRQRCDQPNAGFLTWHTKEGFDHLARA